MMTRTRRALLAAGAATLLTIVLTGCGLIQSFTGANDASRDAEGNVQEQQNVNIFSVKTGDCLMATDETGEITQATVVPCEEPHDEEVFYEFTLPDGEFDIEAVDATAQDACYNENYANFVGVPYEESALEVWYLTPTQQTWDQLDDRLVQCIITDPGVQTTGSLEGVAR